MTTDGGKNCAAWGRTTIYNANPSVNAGTVATNVVDCKQNLTNINAALVLNAAFQVGYTQLSQADVDKGLGYTQRELDEIRAFCPATCGDGTGVYEDKTAVNGYEEYTDANGKTCDDLADIDDNGDGTPDCYRSQDYFFPFSTDSFLEQDDPDFRLKGFSCADWGDTMENSVVECMAFNDQHWLDRGYTQAELDSLRDNCPATCLPYEERGDAARFLVRKNCPVACGVCQSGYTPHNPCAAFEGDTALFHCPDAPNPRGLPTAKHPLVDENSDEYRCCCEFGGSAVMPSPGESREAAAPVLTLTLDVAGVITDFDQSKIDDLRRRVANAAGVNINLVTVVVTGGSVKVTAYITVPVHTPSDTVQEALKSTVGTQAAASTVLGVTVEEPPVVVSNEPPRAPPSPPSPPMQPPSPPPSPPPPSPSPPSPSRRRYRTPAWRGRISCRI